MSNDAKSKELLPCPFCGGPAKVVKWKNKGRSHYTANCTVCDATATDEVYEDNAALKWNRRVATSPAPRGGVTEEMVETVGSALYIYWNDVKRDTRAKYAAKVRAALEKALQTPPAAQTQVRSSDK